MRYTVATTVFELNPNIRFGILVGENLQNSETTASDEARLRAAESKMRETIPADKVRELPDVYLYREIMTKAGINPNKFPPSVEAMFKRIIKGGQVPAINALVDLCNAVSVEQGISLGAHDLNDIQADLEVRYSRNGDVFRPFGADEYEQVEAGELVFVSGNAVQTRKWIWRQSELGKTTLDSTRIFFQLVGFGAGEDSPLVRAMTAIEYLIKNRFQGTCRRYIVDRNNTGIDF